MAVTISAQGSSGRIHLPVLALDHLHHDLRLGSRYWYSTVVFAFSGFGDSSSSLESCSNSTPMYLLTSSASLK